MRSSFLPIPLTHRDSRPLSQAEQDRRESFNAHRRLKLPYTCYYFIGPNERVLLRLEEETHLGITSKSPYDSSQLEPYQKNYKKKKKRKIKRAAAPAHIQEKFTQEELRLLYIKQRQRQSPPSDLDQYFESLFGIKLSNENSNSTNPGRKPI